MATFEARQQFLALHASKLVRLGAKQPYTFEDGSHESIADLYAEVPAAFNELCKGRKRVGSIESLMSAYAKAMKALEELDSQLQKRVPGQYRQSLGLAAVGSESSEAATPIANLSPSHVSTSHSKVSEHLGVRFAASPRRLQSALQMPTVDVLASSEHIPFSPVAFFASMGQGALNVLPHLLFFSAAWYIGMVGLAMVTTPALWTDALLNIGSHLFWLLPSYVHFIAQTFAHRLLAHAQALARHAVEAMVGSGSSLFPQLLAPNIQPVARPRSLSSPAPPVFGACWIVVGAALIYVALVLALWARCRAR